MKATEIPPAAAARMHATRESAGISADAPDIDTRATTGIARTGLRTGFVFGPTAATGGRY